MKTDLGLHSPPRDPELHDKTAPSLARPHTASWGAVGTAGVPARARGPPWQDTSCSGILQGIPSPSTCGAPTNLHVNPIIQCLPLDKFSKLNVRKFSIYMAILLYHRTVFRLSYSCVKMFWRNIYANQSSLNPKSDTDWNELESTANFLICTVYRCLNKLSSILSLAHLTNVSDVK